MRISGATFLHLCRYPFRQLEANSLITTKEKTMGAKTLKLTPTVDQANRASAAIDVRARKAKSDTHIPVRIIDADNDGKATPQDEFVSLSERSIGKLTKADLEKSPWYKIAQESAKNREGVNAFNRRMREENSLGMRVVDTDRNGVVSKGDHIGELTSFGPDNFGSSKVVLDSVCGELETIGSAMRFSQGAKEVLKQNGYEVHTSHPKQGVTYVYYQSMFDENDNIMPSASYNENLGACIYYAPTIQITADPSEDTLILQGTSGRRSFICTHDLKRDRLPVCLHSK